MPIVDLARLSATERDRPNRLRSATGIARRIRRLSRRIFLSASCVNNRVPVFRKANLAQLLPVVLQIRSQPPSLKLRRLRHPNVALAVAVKRPRNTIRLLRRYEVGRKWRRKNLL